MFDKLEVDKLDAILWEKDTQGKRIPFFAKRLRFDTFANTELFFYYYYWESVLFYKTREQLRQWIGLEFDEWMRKRF